MEERFLEKRIEVALKEYQKEHLSLGQAVALSETDYWTFIDLLHQKKIPLVLDEDDQIKEIEMIDRGHYKKFIKDTK